MLGWLRQGRMQMMKKPIRHPDAVVEALKIAIKAHPDQRVMQVIVNACGEDPFYRDDLNAVSELIDYAKRGYEDRCRRENG